MLKTLLNIFIILAIPLLGQSKVYSNPIGHISGHLLLDDSWDRQIYISAIESFEKEFAISNNSIIASARIDSLGYFKIELSEVSNKWSLLRLHLVKKGVSPNSLVIGSRDENFMFLVAKNDSKIELYNTADQPIFKDIEILNADYMQTFSYARKLSTYPNSIDYKNSLIEKEFIEDVVTEKLKTVADTCKNPLVSLYALYQMGFQSDYNQDPTYYNNYLLKWENENSLYFENFRQNFPQIKDASTFQKATNYMLIFGLLGLFVLAGLFVYNKRTPKINSLSVQERKIFGLLRKGMSNKEISAECNIGITTVKTHVGNIYSKLNIKSRKEVMNIKTKIS